MRIDRNHGTKCWSCAALVTFSMLTVIGCMGTAVPTGTVSGKVTYNDKPVPEGCLVTFISDRGVAALGTVDANGQYKLMMAGKLEVPVVKYNVSVTFPGIVGPEMTEEDERKFNAGDPEMLAKFTQKPRKSPIPEKYANEIKSGLVFELKEGPNTIDIDLK